MEESVVYEIEYTEQFLKDILKYKASGNRAVLSKIDSFIDELRVHPKTGTGKPEALRGNRKGQWSRRITREHRLIYEIEEHRVTVVLLSAHSHYGEK
jgi:toxin YoeB